jgi:hypothetical protein
MSLAREAGVGGGGRGSVSPGGVLQRVSSGSEARGRSVRRVRQTWFRRVTGKRTGEAMTLEAQGPTRGPVICKAPIERADFMTAFATYSSENAARRAVAARRGDGAEDDVRLLIGRALHDTRRERVGGFAWSVAPDDRVASFANRPVQRRRGCGSFAGDPDRQRQGCFADSDRVVVVTRRDGVERSRATSELGVCRLLRRTGLSDEVVVGAIGELRAGHTVVVVDRTVVGLADARGRSEHVREAA